MIPKTLVVDCVPRKRSAWKEENLMFLGRPIYSSEFFEHRFPKKHYKGRSKRLRNKWMNRYGYYSFPRKDAIITAGGILCHPNTLWRFTFLGEKSDSI